MTASIDSGISILSSHPPSPDRRPHKQHTITTLRAPTPLLHMPSATTLSPAPSRQLARSAPPCLGSVAVTYASDEEDPQGLQIIMDPVVAQKEQELDIEVPVAVSITPESDVGEEDSDSVESSPWEGQTLKGRLNRSGSVGNSWGITSVGRGFDWRWKDEPSSDDEEEAEAAVSQPNLTTRAPAAIGPLDPIDISPPTDFTPTDSSTALASQTIMAHPETAVIPASPPPFPPISTSFSSFGAYRSDSPTSLSPVGFPRSPGTSSPPTLSRSPSSPRLSRRRSSQKRVSLISGRLSMIDVNDAIATEDHRLEPPHTLNRLSSASSFKSLASSVAAPPTPKLESFLGERSIDDYVIIGEAGRGAYGLVKRAKEILPNGDLGPPLIIKQVIKSRILADCWKKHPVHGTIPIEIYVMNALSSTSYVLPARPPWHPSRYTDAPSDWEEGKVVKGHPNICPLLDFFEDRNYYYLVLPSSAPPPRPGLPQPASDLFDLVEQHPQGLPPRLIRSYLGQMADALRFLHARGIVHRDIKDENVVLGEEEGKCWLIDFGSSGIVRRGGWDTFSGTLDYAGPEILRGERYTGKEQDVWAFGVVGYVLLCGECPFTTAAEAQLGLVEDSKARTALEERCGGDKENDGEEPDGGGRLGDCAALVRACLNLEVEARPTFERILTCRFLSGGDGWGMDEQ